MNFEEIYDDKFKAIEKGMSLAFNTIAKAIEKDKTFTLADDEVAELIYEIMEKYLNDTSK